MAQADALILRELGPRARPGDARAIRRHRDGVLAAAAWTRLVAAARARDAAALAHALRAPAGAWPGVLAKAAGAAPRVLRRLASHAR